jgi:hypothetical protein
MSGGRPEPSPKPAVAPVGAGARKPVLTGPEMVRQVARAAGDGWRPITHTICELTLIYGAGISIQTALA